MPINITQISDNRYYYGKYIEYYGKYLDYYKNIK